MMGDGGAKGGEVHGRDFGCEGMGWVGVGWGNCDNKQAMIRMLCFPSNAPLRVFTGIALEL